MSRDRILAKAWLLAMLAAAAFQNCGAFCQSPPQGAAAPPSARIAHRVQAIYFHRTHRCPTCMRISAYIEEAIRTGFARQLKDGQVRMHLIDFQDPKNQRYTKAYRISGPTLVLVDVNEDKATAWKPMPEVWSLVAKKQDFFQYVQDGVRDYLEQRKPPAAGTAPQGRPQAAATDAPSREVRHQVAAVYFHRTQRCPTCRRISAYIEEAVGNGFPEQIQDGQVAVRLVDFQNPRNRAQVEYFKITGPTLVLADVHDGKLVAWKPMPEVWSLVAKKGDFFKYVHDGVRNYMEGER